MRALAYLGLLVIASASVARAEPEALQVERSGAEACPDAAQLQARIEAIRGGPLDASSPYTVRFGRTGDAYSAVIEGQTGNERTLTSNEATCDALAQATALTLALLFDAAPPPSAATKPPVAIIPPPSAASPAPIERRRDRLSLALGAAALIGILRPIAPALLADVSLTLERFRFAVAALWVPRQTISLAPGRVSQSLWSADGRACIAPWLAPPFRLDACSGALVGAIHAEGHGFTEDRERTRTFIALPFELSLGYVGNSAGVELAAGLIVPLTRHEFAIDGLGAAYHPPPLAAMISLRVLGLIP
ncbi:MAG TPA: hypothetical protein VHZ95_10870 [Polyangiales bacterium]|nr:hypothetical protein [Polyangiales bacterium]